MTIFVGVSKKCRQNEPKNKKNRTEEAVFEEKKHFMGVDSGRQKCGSQYAHRHRNDSG